MDTLANRIKAERIEAYKHLMTIFPSAIDMGNELQLDSRSTVGQWKKRGVPIEYIMLLDILGIVSKEELVPTIRNWDFYLSKHDQVIRNKLNKILLADNLNKTASTTLQSVLEPVVKKLVRKAMDEINNEDEGEDLL